MQSRRRWGPKTPPIDVETRRDPTGSAVLIRQCFAWEVLKLSEAIEIIREIEITGRTQGLLATVAR